VFVAAARFQRWGPYVEERAGRRVSSDDHVL